MAEFTRPPRSADYWARRSEWIEQNVMKDVDQINKTIQEGYERMLRDIQTDISEFIGNNPKFYNMNAVVSHKEYLEKMDSLFKDLDKVKKQSMKAHQSVYDAIDREMKRTNIRFKRTRLEVLQEQIRARMTIQTAKTHKSMMTGLTDTFLNTYDRKQFVIQRGVGYGYQYSKPNFKAIEKAILYPWAEDGSMFSDRIWNYVDQDAKSLTDGVRQAIVSDAVGQGKKPSDIARDLTGFGSKSLSRTQIRNNASRLLYTEASHILGEASAEVSQEWGFTEYVYLATLDDRTSSVCQGLDGSVFKYKDRQAGTNFPPMHPFCRSTTYDVVPNAIYTNRASRMNGKTVHQVPASATYSQWKEWQKTGKKPWEQKPKAKPKPQKTNLSKMADEILEKNTFLSDTHKNDLRQIMNSWDEKTTNLYNKLQQHAGKNQYYKKGTGFYRPWERRIYMDMDDIVWEKRVGLERTGAFGTKFHEEFHQLDHIISERMDGVPGGLRLTDPLTPRGAKLSQAINDDVIGLFNEAIDWANTNGGGKPIKHIKQLNRIPTDAKRSLLSYMKVQHPTPKDRALISGVTDAIGLQTEGRFNPYDYGFWGHSKKYAKEKGIKGATSETWATFGSMKLDDAKEQYEIFKKMMPKTTEAYEELLEEVLDFAEKDDLKY